MPRKQPVAKTSLLLTLCNPFDGCWPELDTPLTLRDVRFALEEGVPELEPPFEFSWTEPPPQRVLRLKHARKVAWFVENGFSKPLEIDVGVPSLGVLPSWPLIDGNHRFAAAVFRYQELGEDPLLPISVSGSVSYANELGLAV